MNDPILDAPISTFDQVYALFVFHWREILARAQQWYRDSHGGVEPADSDIGHAMVRVLAEGARWGTLRRGLEDSWPTGVPIPAPPPSARPNAGEHGKLRVDGYVFRREDGSIFNWTGADSFLLTAKLMTGQEDLAHRLMDELIDPFGDGSVKGANLIRVIPLVDWTNQTGPQFDGGRGPRIGPEDVKWLRRTADFLAGRGLRGEFSFGDMVKTIPNKDDRISYMHAVAAEFAGSWNALFEFNEPGHVDQVSPEEAVELGNILRAAGLLVSYGIYDIPFGTTRIPYGDYCTVHDERKDEWPRAPRDCRNFYDGWDWKDGNDNVVGHFDGCPVPWIDDESMGAANVAIPGKRSDSVSDFRDYGATAAMLASGATIHFDNGIYSNLLEPHQREIVREFFFAMHFAPAETKLAPYQRGAAGGGPGIGDMPIEHFDLDEVGREPRHLRAFAKTLGDRAWAIGIRSTVEHEVARGGWLIDEQPRRGLVRLRRP